MTCLAQLLTISNNLWDKFMLFMQQYQWQSLLSIKQYYIMIMNDEVRLSKTWQTDQEERGDKEDQNTCNPQKTLPLMPHYFTQSPCFY
jgi:hypothetical protein